ncbi:galactoside alpha-(1,2)-fucosyltransferase 2-like [Mercenaria mercenaria]|uniref:galactoside alpha-(1,2)-fucosyltransferase 2-like n=1 Tax=Mercenaria mercenaria TaxID=6596 RepID=UPI00234F7ECE|nr:galactoside alpha-(1,2)-fucosyltransferase 2-like [Mercenaria mercenaria]
MADEHKERSVLYQNKVTTMKEKNSSSESVHGAFFSRNKGMDEHSKGETWLTVYPGRGRLGNQMFQIASLIGIADKFGYRPFISSTSFDIDSVFDVPQSSNLNVDLTKFIKYQETDAGVFAECDITRYTDMSVLTLNSNWTLDGYLQSFKHFVHIQNDINDLFTFKSNILDEARQFINNSTTQYTVKIGIHIRRGDFLSEYHRNLGRVTPEAGMTTVLSTYKNIFHARTFYWKTSDKMTFVLFTDYYQKAMDLYSTKYRNITFFVFSNDIAWCKGHLLDLGHEVIFSTYNHPGYDLAIMSLCDHMIISVGTFGWWGGWLAGGSVVYFNGYPKPGSEISKYFIKEDFYPSDWIGIT